MKHLYVPALLIILASCSSAESRRQQREESAKEEYDTSMKGADEKYKKEKMDEQKEEAKGMVDDAKKVKSNKDSGTIKVED
jgi:hypothetical protein